MAKNFSNQAVKIEILFQILMDIQTRETQRNSR